MKIKYILLYDLRICFERFLKDNEKKFLIIIEVFKDEELHFLKIIFEIYIFLTISYNFRLLLNYRL